MPPHTRSPHCLSCGRALVRRGPSDAPSGICCRECFSAAYGLAVARPRSWPDPLVLGIMCITGAAIVLFHSVLRQ